MALAFSEETHVVTSPVTYKFVGKRFRGHPSKWLQRPLACLGTVSHGPEIVLDRAVRTVLHLLRTRRPFLGKIDLGSLDGASKAIRHFRARSHASPGS